MRGVFLTLIMLILLAMPCLAEEIRQEAMPQYAGMVAYYGVESGRLYVAYNPEHLSEIFGEGNIIEGGETGMITIKYMHNGQLKSFGTLSGLILADPSWNHIQVINGAYNQPTDSQNRNPIKIEGKEFAILVRNPAKPLFEIKNGAYSQGRGWFFGCRESETEYLDCEMVAVVTATGAYLNITGEGFVSKGDENLRKYLNEGYVKLKESYEECSTLYPSIELIKCSRPKDVANMHEVIIGDSEPSKFEMEFSSYSGTSRFDDIEIKPFGKAKLKAFTELGTPLLLEGMNTEVISQTATIGIKAKFADTFVKLIKEGADRKPIATVTRGSAIITNSIGTYEACMKNENPYNKFACAYFGQNEKTIRIKPRAIGGSPYVPLWLNVNIPAGYENVIIEPFDTSGNDILPNIVILTKEGTSTQLKFYKDDIALSEGGNWFDLGVSFTAYLLPKDAVAEGEQPLSFYDKLECRNPATARDCYLNGAQVQGFTALRRNYRCNNDNDCGAGKKCIDRLCVTESTCSPVPGYSGNGLNVLFVSDEYSDNAEFKRDIDLVLKGEGEYKGFLEVEPFASNAGKFKFYMINGGNMPIDEKVSGKTPSALIIRRVAKQCAAADNIIALSKKEFMPHAELNSNLAFVSQKKLYAENFGKSLVVLHEFGHSFGRLRDEYHTFEAGKAGITGDPNCLRYEQAKQKWGQELADRAKEKQWKGCGGICDNRCLDFLRPRLNSIMRNQWNNIVIPDDPESAEEGRGDTFSEPSLRQLQEMIACISAETPCLV